MKYYLIAGEASGDLHASNLMKDILELDNNAQFEFFGGDLMLSVGGTLHKHYRDMAFMGIVPVLLNLRNIQKNFTHCKKTLLQSKPDVVILVDYPGFNLRMAEFSKHLNIPTAYYISPKIWAWKTHRIKKVKAFVDQMYTILPFETEFYQKYEYPVTYVGNPLFETIRQYKCNPFSLNAFRRKNDLSDKPIVALLAGSRKHEIQALLPAMLETSKHFPNFQFVIAGAPGITADMYSLANQNRAKVIYNQTYDLLRASRAALVTSGTATLETALFNVPQVVCYKMGLGWFLERFRNQILKTPFFSLVNLIAGREVVKELFQSEVTVKNLKGELKKILDDNQHSNCIMEGYSDIAAKLEAGYEPKKAASHLINWLRNTLQNEKFV
jgi:lipid-A-disaccharide synthase